MTGSALIEEDLFAFLDAAFAWRQALAIGADVDIPGSDFLGQCHAAEADRLFGRLRLQRAAGEDQQRAQHEA